jgi:hypothetical protein
MASKRTMPLVLCTIVLIVWALDSFSWLFVPGSTTKARTLRTGRREQNWREQIDLGTERDLVAKFQEEPRKLRSEVNVSSAAPSVTRAAKIQSIFREVCAIGASSEAASVTPQQLKDGFAELLSIHLSSDQAHWIVKEHDTDKDGVLSFREFASAYEWLKLNSIEFASACLLREEQQTRIMGRTMSRNRVNLLVDDADGDAPENPRMAAIMAFSAFWAFGIASGLLVRTILTFPTLS